MLRLNIHTFLQLFFGFIFSILYFKVVHLHIELASYHSFEYINTNNLKFPVNVVNYFLYVRKIISKGKMGGMANSKGVTSSMLQHRKTSLDYKNRQ